MNKILPILTALFMLGCSPSNDEQTEKSIALIGAGNQVELFADRIISTEFNERDIAINREGTLILYSLGDYTQSQRILVQLAKISGKWSQPVMLPFSGRYDDIEPHFAPDGKRLFFASDRPLHEDDESKDYNLWYSDRSESGWTDPVALGPEVNSEVDEYYPSVSNNGNLYFTAAYEGGIGTEDLYVSEYVNDQYTKPTLLDTNVNSKSYEFNAFVSPEEDYIIFGSIGRPDGNGGGDLYISWKDSAGNWTPSQNLGDKINSEKLDYCPFVDVSRNTFYFTSNRKPAFKTGFNSISDFYERNHQSQNGMSDLYRMSFDELWKTKGK